MASIESREAGRTMTQYLGQRNVFQCHEDFLKTEYEAAFCSRTRGLNTADLLFPSGHDSCLFSGFLKDVGPHQQETGCGDDKSAHWAGLP